MFATNACNPYGTQQACVTTTNKLASTSLTLTAGTTYLIMFYTNGSTYTMVNPQITIQ